jgi:hypothetical protein
MTMEQLKFKQSRLLKKRYYEIVKDGVDVCETSLTNSIKYKVAFENIAQQPQEVSTSFNLLLWIAVVLLSLSVLTLLLQLFGQDVENGTFAIWGGLGILAGIGFFISRACFLIYNSNNHYPRLVFYKDKPSKEQFTHFITAVHDKQREYLRQNYLINTEAVDSVNAIQKLVWLKEQQAISEDEYENLKKDIIEKARWSNIQPPSIN